MNKFARNPFNTQYGGQPKTSPWGEALKTLHMTPNHRTIVRKKRYLACLGGRLVISAPISHNIAPHPRGYAGVMNLVKPK